MFECSRSANVSLKRLLNAYVQTNIFDFSRREYAALLDLLFLSITVNDVCAIKCDDIMLFEAAQLYF